MAGIWLKRTSGTGLGFDLWDNLKAFNHAERTIQVPYVATSLCCVFCHPLAAVTAGRRHFPGVDAGSNQQSSQLVESTALLSSSLVFTRRTGKWNRKAQHGRQGPGQSTVCKAQNFSVRVIRHSA
jgi:hypothetical protein